MGNENEVSGEPRPAGVKSKSLLSYAAGERTARSPAPAQPKPSLAVGQILVSVRSTQQPPAHQPPPEWTPVIASSHVKSQVILVCGMFSTWPGRTWRGVAGRTIIGRITTTHRRIRRRPSSTSGCPCRSLRRRSSGTRRSTPRPGRA